MSPVIAGVLGVEQLLQLRSQTLDLLVGQDADAGDIAVFVEEADLFIAETIAIPFVGGTRQRE
jgi:hypothetical protein